jgi:hypothetical protein
MRRSYIKCPYCGRETALQGIDMHVKVNHPDKHAEFRGNYETLKKSAVRKEIDTTPPKVAAKVAKASQPPGSGSPGPAPAASRQPEKSVPQRTVSALTPAPAKPLAAEPVAPAHGPGGETPAAGPGAQQKSFLEEVADGFFEWLNTP